MRAVLRLGMAIAAAGLWLGQAPALAQSTPPATTNTPAADSVGPRELQNFNLQGTVSRPAETTPAPRPTAKLEPESVAATPAPQPHAPRRTARTEQPRTEAAPPPPATAAAQPPISLPVTPTAAAPAPAAASLPVPAADVPPANLAPERSLPLWPWLLAALALGAGGAFILWRRNSREAYAGGPHVDEFVAPEPQPRPSARPAPAPAPAPSPAPAPAPAPTGFVSTRMRPWIEIGFQPLRCIVGEQRVTFEFEVELVNSGNAPARDVLIEGVFFNAGPTEDEEIGAYFESNSGQGEQIPVIPPGQRINLRPQLDVALDQLRMLEAGERKFFVPLIALKAMYAWGGGAGQSSAAWLLGRDTKGEKLAPFRVDLGARVFRGLGARALPISVRR